MMISYHALHRAYGDERDTRGAGSGEEGKAELQAAAEAAAAAQASP
jgi:hypothetical protein